MRHPPPCLPRAYAAPPSGAAAAHPPGDALGRSGEALAGLGGAVFSIPMLVRYGGLAQRAAAGTALTAVIGTATASAVTFGAAGHLDVGVAAVLGACRRGCCARRSAAS